MTGLDVVFSAECFYSPQVPTLARELGVRTVLAPNFEFLDPHVQPDLWAAPSLWRFDEIPSPKVHLPVPIPTDRFKQPSMSEVGVQVSSQNLNLLHIVGRPAVHDRNGTEDLLQALQYVTAEVKVIFRCQSEGYLDALLSKADLPDNVEIDQLSRDVENYWDNYSQGDVLLMPRRFGGLCLPVNEALGAGMPVIMPDISPNNTWLPSDWLVPAKHAGSFKAKQHIDIYSVDHRAYAEKIDAFASDPGFYTKARQEALELREQYSWENLRPTYLRTLQEL
jgi:glycosyltransferase involved in cell wall biosynthesis